MQRPNSSAYGDSQTAAGLNPGESEEFVSIFLVLILGRFVSLFPDMEELFVLCILFEFLISEKFIFTPL